MGGQDPRHAPPDALLPGLAHLAGLQADAVLRGRIARLPPPVLAGALGREAGLDDPAWAAVLDAVTVQESRLFRHPAQFAALAGWLHGRPPARLLSAGCATGEEAWSLAALAGPAGSVLGLDLCRPALARAQAALYGPGPPDPRRDVPGPWRDCFPLRDGIARPAAALCATTRFARASLTRLPGDLPLFDAILCRNVLIYLTPAARSVVLAGLAGRLVPGGLLVLGATDSPGPALGLRPFGPPGLAIWAQPA